MHQNCIKRTYFIHMCTQFHVFKFCLSKRKKEKKCQKMLQLQWLNFYIHPETVRRRLRNRGMLARRPHQSNPLTPRHKLERLR